MYIKRYGGKRGVKGKRKDRKRRNCQRERDRGAAHLIMYFKLEGG